MISTPPPMPIVPRGTSESELCPQCKQVEDKEVITRCKHCGYIYCEDSSGCLPLVLALVVFFVLGLICLGLFYSLLEWITSDKTLVNILSNVFIEPFTRLLRRTQ